MREKAPASWITQPFSIQKHCCSVSTELLVFTTSKWSEKKQWRAWTLFPKVRNSIQKQNSPFRNKQAKFRIKFSPADRSVVKSRTPSRWSQSRPAVVSPISPSPSASSLYHHRTGLVWLGLRSPTQPHKLHSWMKTANSSCKLCPWSALLLLSPQHFSKTSLELAKKTHVKSPGLVEEQEAWAVETSESSGMNSEACIPHKARERAHYSKRTINKEKN